MKNTGSRPGAEAVQLYAGEDSPSVLRPLKELKGIDKVTLAPGESRTSVFRLATKELAFWNDRTHAWQLNPGKYTLYIGTSSADIAHVVPITIEN